MSKCVESTVSVRRLGVIDDDLCVPCIYFLQRGEQVVYVRSSRLGVKRVFDALMTVKRGLFNVSG